MFDYVSFGAEDVRAVATGTATKRQLMVVLTSHTCGEACWHAKEDVCRCSCGGKNHGCLVNGGAKPERTAKIDGERYTLAGVGPRDSLMADAAAINKAAGYRSVDKPMLSINGQGRAFSEQEIAAAKASGARIRWHQYRYTWSETDAGAPARVKMATRQQIDKWAELQAWRGLSDFELYQAGVALLWKRVEMPARPAQPVVDEMTGEPLPVQTP